MVLYHESLFYVLWLYKEQLVISYVNIAIRIFQIIYLGRGVLADLKAAFLSPR